MSEQGPIKQLLLSNSFWVLSKPLVYKLGLEPAFLLSNFAEAENLSSNGWFYQTIETVEEKTTLSRRKQDKAIEQLEKLGILESDIRGIPAKRYFKINYDVVGAILFEQNEQPSLYKTNKLECAKRTTNKEPINKELNYKEDIYSQAEARPPIPYKEIIEYLNDKTGRNYNFKAKTNRGLIKARFNEGYTLDDFKRVIDIKVDEWDGTKWDVYLRPKTLFSGNFDNYLNQEVKNGKSSKSDGVDEIFGFGFEV